MSKDILAPLATIIASIVAAIITWIFQRRQVRIARAKLRLDVFEKKYKIYTDAKRLLALVLNDCWEIIRIRLHGNEIASLYVSLDESRFFCDPATSAFLKICEQNCEEFLKAMAEKENISDDDRGDFAEQAGKLSQAIRDNFRDLPARFEPELRIET